VPKLSGRMLWGIVAELIAAQMILTLVMVHRESLTVDEDNHMIAGYMMWHTKDYGLNPEHPPFVKLLATAPLLGRPLWVPELKGRDFKTEAYLDGGIGWRATTATGTNWFSRCGSPPPCWPWHFRWWFS
jgi:hypothetical protein